ncbi:serine/threonine-protein kinase [Actinomadura sp. HBU206391]|uniref:serine/threonine-protein kinase n=1 Tax=Actinomadura sp. HBU206391 TaxID=2731692 RepID=UPI00164FA6A1|nr:serine/threonine-protein kinase [Actinomadura sp. HBU206391]MBC6458457.1 protein kinase [Actinomadura sp. HBU206391]
MPAVSLEPGDPRRLGRFRLLGRLGEGGQGIVYLGEGPAGEQVAVKVLKTGADPRARDRLSREMAAAMRVAQFCTARVIDSSVDGPLPYIVSEFVDGPSLQDRVSERGPLYDGDLDRLMLNTARALRAIHRVGIVHRDLKPANILLGPDGPRVVDFGIARAIDADVPTQMVGTPAYFAPEWLRNEPPTPASDVFAWAGTMVFAATGRPPFGHNTNLHAVLNRVANDDPDLSGVPQRLVPLLEQCLDKDPARRPTAAEVDERLLDAHVGSDAEQDTHGRGAGGRRDVPPPPPDATAPSETSEPARPPDPAVTSSDPDPAEPRGRPVPPEPARASAGRSPVRDARPRPEPMRAATTQAPVPPADPGTGHERAPRPPLPREASAPRPHEPSPRPRRDGRRRRVALLVTLLVIVAVGAALGLRLVRGGSEDATIPQAYEGTWTGTVLQGEGFDNNGVGATMTMQQGQRSATLRYSTLTCDSELSLKEHSAVELTFEVTRGQCPAGTVRVFLSDGVLELNASGPQTYTANGKLRRSGG